MHIVLKSLFQRINKQDFPYSLSSRLDAPCQSSQQGRRNFLHPCQFFRDFCWNLVKPDRIGR